MDIELPLLRQPLPTRKERYRHLKKLEYSRINDPYTRCRKALKTTHDVQKTVVLLNKELSNLVGLSPQTNSILTTEELEKIKISSNTFSRIIRDSKTFQNDLTEIKRHYDNRLNTLLCSMNHIGFKSCDTRSHDQSFNLDVLKREVKRLQTEAVKLIKENEKLHQLCEEEEVKQEVKQEEEIVHINNDKDYIQKIDEKQFQILVQREEIIKSNISREDLVPLSVCQKLEQCIRSTELEIQRLKKSNSLIQGNIHSLETKLQRYFEAVRTPEDQVMYVWKCIEKTAQNNI